MHGARFDRAGKLLDATAKVLSPGGSSSTDFLSPTVAFDGTVFVVAWGQQPGSSTSYINAVRVTSAGVVMDTTPKHLVTATVSPLLASPVLIHDGSDLVLAWSEGSTRVLVSRVAPDLTLRDAPPLAVSTPTTGAFTPVLASDGGGFLIAWGEGDATLGRSVRAQRYAANMTATAPAVTVDPAQTTAVNYLAAAFDGVRFTVGWARSGTETDLFIARLDGTAAVVGSVQPFAPGPGSQYGLMLWGAAGRTLVAWSDVGGLYAQVLGADGTPVAPRARGARAEQGAEARGGVERGRLHGCLDRHPRLADSGLRRRPRSERGAGARDGVPDPAIRDHDGRPGSRLGRNEFARGVEWEHDQHHARAPVRSERRAGGRRD